MRKMFTFLFLAVLIMLTAVAVTNRKAEAQRGYMYGQVLKTTRLGPYAVGIVCLNGADPTGRKASGVLIVSCNDSDEPAKK